MKQIKRSALVLSFTALGLLAGCSSTDSANKGTNSNVILNSDSSQLSKRMSSDNNGVITIDPAPAGKSADAPTTLPLTQVSEVLPPVDANGLKLQATQVAVNGNYAYVAYAAQGPVYSGAIDVIDVTDPTKPKLIIAALVPNTDINAITYSNGKLLMAASTDVDKRVGLKSPSIALDMQLTSGLLTGNCTESDLYGFVTTDIAANNSNYFAVTGDNGKLFKIDNTNDQILGSTPMADLRSVGLYQDKIVTLSGTNGVNIFNASDLSLAKSFSVSVDNVQGAKRSFDFLGSSLICAEGANGISVYDMATGVKGQTFPLNTTGITNVADAQSNAVSVNENYVFTANGAAGLNVFEATTSGLINMGNISYPQPNSCNYVKSSGNYIYAATGNGGLKIIKMTKPAVDVCGLPAYAGSTDMDIKHDQVSYSGTTALNSIEIESGGNPISSLFFCGNLAVANDLTIDSNASFTMVGTLNQGKTNPNPTKQNPVTVLTVSSNSTMTIQGNVTIWGDFVLASNSNLVFTGSNSSITVMGKVTKGSNLNITGTFVDVKGNVK